MFVGVFCIYKNNIFLLLKLKKIVFTAVEVILRNHLKKNEEEL